MLAGPPEGKKRPPEDPASASGSYLIPAIEQLRPEGEPGDIDPLGLLPTILHGIQAELAQDRSLRLKGMMTGGTSETGRRPA